MSIVGPPIGNNNAAFGHLFRDTLRTALRRYEGHGSSIKRGKALRHIMYGLIKEALEGNIQAIKEVADRLDGKPAQAITGPSGEPITLVERVIVMQAIEQSEIIDDQDSSNTIEMVPDHESMTYVRKLEEKQIVDEKTQ